MQDYELESSSVRKESMRKQKNKMTPASSERTELTA